MPRPKKQHLKQRKDGRYCCKYHGIQFMGATSEEALAARDAYKKQEGSAQIIGGTTVGEYATAWLPRTKVGVSFSTYNESAKLLEKLLKSIGSMQFPDVKPSDIKAVYSAQFAGLSDSYIRTAAILYRSLFDSAVADGLCRTNPARDKTAKPHKGTYTGHRAITPQERHWIDTLCLNHRCRPAVMAMLYEGLRPPEAKAFNIDDSVDLSTNTIRLVAFAHRAKKNRYIITDQGKTKKAAREIPLFSPFREAIKGKSGPLVPTARGGELTMQAWRVVWNSYVHQMEKEINGMDKRWYGRTREHKAILASGGTLPPWITFTVRPYDLRHSFCTMCRDAGVEINTCIKWMGHADAKMILKVYDEVSPERIQSEAEKLEKSLNRMQNGMQKRVYRVKRSKIKASSH